MHIKLTVNQFAPIFQNPKICTTFAVMKRYLKLVVAAAVLLWGGMGDAAARQVHNISAGWTFFSADEPSTDGAATVNLPHVQTSASTVNYLRQIDVPTEWVGHRVFLRVGGASRVADVFVDGRHAATHRGAGSPFTVEITSRLTAGTPASVRIVVGGAPGFDVLPTAGREKIYGGIFRPVELIVCEPLSVSPAASLDPRSGDAEGTDGIWISTDRLVSDRAQGRVRLSLMAPGATLAAGTVGGIGMTGLTGPTGVSGVSDVLGVSGASGFAHSYTASLGAVARVRFLDEKGDLAAQSILPVAPADTDLVIPFTLSDPHLWQGIEDPYLYNVEVTLTGPDGLVTDSLTVPYGFRSVAVDPDGNFTLNSRPMKIHGVILPRDRQLVGTALTPFQIEEDIDLILEMGANAVRVAGGPHSDYFYDLCDQAGLMVWNDGPFTGAAYPTDIDWIDTGTFRENGRRQLVEMISSLYNHPSVAMWGVFSNITARGGDPLPYIRELNSLVHSLDPTRLTAGSSVSDGEINFITDVISFDLAFGWESSLPDAVVPWLDQLRAGWPDLGAGISYGAGGSIFHQSERLERPAVGSPFHPEGWQTFFHEEYARYAVDAPGLWGVFVANMFDSGAAKTPSAALGTSPGSESGALDDRGLVTFDRKDRKDAFWLYKAIWNHTDPFVRIAGGRLDGRTERRQSIRVYSNMPEVELFVGGRSQGRITGEGGVFVWNDINLRVGINRLEARSDGAAPHRISISINTSSSTPRPATQSVASGIAAPPPDEFTPRSY
jgi:beta-galactosidase